MADVIPQIKGAFGGEFAVGALYVGLISFVLADSIPTLGDVVTLEWQTNLRNEWKQGTISAADYWKGALAAYYLPNIFYWGIIFLIVVNIPGNIHKKFYVAIALISSGALIGVVYNLYNKDKRQKQLEAEATIPKQ